MMQRTKSPAHVGITLPGSIRARLARFHGLFEKEFALQNSSGFTLINRLLIGPLISLATTGILYSSFFRVSPDANLGGISGGNYATFLAFGFLMHTYLNAGYYCFSGKLVQEAMSGTLKLLWMAPYHRVLSLFSLASMEILRCGIVLVLAMLIAATPGRPWIEAIALQLLAFVVFLPVCLSLGLLRAMVVMTSNDLADLLDHAYLFVVLSACPYIPNSLLPEVLQPVSQLNPAYHMGYLMRSAWGAPVDGQSHWVPLALLVLIVFATGFLMWRRLRGRLLQRCFA